MTKKLSSYDAALAQIENTRRRVRQHTADRGGQLDLETAVQEIVRLVRRKSRDPWAEAAGIIAVRQRYGMQFREDSDGDDSPSIRVIARYVCSPDSKPLDPRRASQVASIVEQLRHKPLEKIRERIAEGGGTDALAYARARPRVREKSSSKRAARKVTTR